MAKGEDGPILKLIMEKGPLAGIIRDFRSGSKIKIGRIARGNTFAIKDDGISSKHISINFDSQTGPVGKWTISDLGSSNGTFLNGQALDSFTPAQLSDGDVIKIGEWTSIIVKFEDVRVDVGESKVRRNQTRGRGRNLGVVDEISEIIMIKDDENKRTTRGRRGKTALQNNELAEGEGFNEGEMGCSKRVTRSNAINRKGVEGEVEEINILGRKACSRRNGRKKEEKLNENGVQDTEQMEHLVQDGENCIKNEIGIKAKGIQEESLKRTTRSVKKENLEILSGNELQSSEERKTILPIEAKDGENVSLRSRRTLRKEGNLTSLGENGGENNKRGRGRRGRKNLGMETLTENDEAAEIGSVEKVVEKLNSEREVLEEGKENLQVKEVLQEHGKDLDGLVEEGVQFAAEVCEELASTSGVKENGGNEVDLEKMTLGEWFDYLDVHLPKQIIDATEEMILDMRQKAEKFHDFMLQQKNCRSKVELPVV